MILRPQHRSSVRPGPHRSGIVPALRQKGATLVELALTIALNLVLLFAFIDVALATYNLGILDETARQTARTASLFRGDIRDPDNRVRWIDSAELRQTANRWSGLVIQLGEGETVVKLNGVALDSLPNRLEKPAWAVEPGFRVEAEASLAFRGLMSLTFGGFAVTLERTYVMYVE